MNEDPLPPLRDTLLRRELTPDEERQADDWIQRHPEQLPSWHEDRALARQLRRLPAAPVSTNFTALVMAEIARDSRASSPTTPPRAWWLTRRWRFWLAPGTALLIVTLSAVTWQGYQHRAQREQARNLSTLRVLNALSPATLADFEVIQRFGESASPVDFELLAALQ